MNCVSLRDSSWVWSSKLRLHSEREGVCTQQLCTQPLGLSVARVCEQVWGLPHLSLVSCSSDSCFRLR